MSREEELEKENQRLKDVASRRDDEALKAIFAALDGIKGEMGQIRVTCERRCGHTEACLTSLMSDVTTLKTTVYGTAGKQREGLEYRTTSVEAWKTEIVAKKARTWAIAISAIVMSLFALGKEWVWDRLYGH